MCRRLATAVTSLPLPGRDMILVYLRIAGLLAGLISLVWVVDAIGDRREAKVRAEYAAEVAAANGRASVAQDQWRSYYEAELARRLGVQARLDRLDTSSAVCEKKGQLRVELNSIHPRETRR